MPLLSTLANASSRGYRTFGAPASTTSYESIQTVTVGSGGASSITFSSIPSTFKHLQVRFIARDNAGTAGADDMFINFNSGAGTYMWHRLIGDGASVTAAGGTPSSSIGTISAAAISRGGNASGIFSSGIIDILDYQNTNKYKTYRALYGWDVNGSGNIAMGSGVWMATSAITSIAFTAESARSFTQYSQFALFGVKG